MPNIVWHATRNVKIYLNRADLGNPGIPELFDEITTPVAKRDREMLMCWECHEKGTCPSVSAGKGPWVTIRRSRIEGKVVLVPAHLPVTHPATPEESALHKAIKERIAEVATRAGLYADTEVWDANRTTRADILVRGHDGSEYAWETQISIIRGEWARERDRRARRARRLPVWLVASADAPLINKVNWARVDKVNWHHIATGQPLRIAGGFRRLQKWICTPSADRLCPAKDKAGSYGLYCGREHLAFDIPGLCTPRLPNLEVDEVVPAMAEHAVVPLKLPRGAERSGGGRALVLREERDEFRGLLGLPDDEDDLAETAAPIVSEVTYDEDAPEDGECPYGREDFIPGSPRPVLDRAKQSYTFTVGDQFTGQPVPLWLENLTPPERRRLAGRLGCWPNHIGPCVRCTEPAARFGIRASQFCPECQRRYGVA
jgi:hypothetical protein